MSSILQDVCDATPWTIRPLCPDKVLGVEFAGRWTRYLGSGDRASLPGALSYQREAGQRQVVVRHDWPMGLTKWGGICDRETSAQGPFHRAPRHLEEVCDVCRAFPLVE
jgi:hypothetical protein